jgi:hypothetical protein
MGKAPSALHWNEPDNIDADPTGLRPVGRSGFGPYPVISADQDGGIFRALWEVSFSGKVGSNALGSRSAKLLKPFLRLPKSILHPAVKMGAKLLNPLPVSASKVAVKTVYAPFCLEWLAKTFDPTVVIIQREPLNVISSWRELKIPMFDLLTRPSLRQFYGDLPNGSPPDDEASEIEKMAWCVGLITHTFARELDEHPDWVLVEHGDLCVDTENKFKRLFEQLGLGWSEDVSEYLRRSNRPGQGLAPVRVTSQQVNRWKGRLSDEEVERIRAVLDKFPNQGWVRRPRE